MQTKYKDETGRILTLKKAAPEWFNDDCPSLYRLDNGERVWCGWSLYSGIETVDQNEAENIEKFKENSRKAFIKKYPKCARVI